MKKIKVLKFGGTSLNDEHTRQHVMNIISKESQNYRLVVIVSAIGRAPHPYATDTLLYLGNRLNSKDLDALLSCGETIACSVLCNECLSRNISCCCVNYTENGIKTNTNYLDGEILDINSDDLYCYLKKYDVVIVPGFFGTNKFHFVTSLGRGGSDLSAVAIAFSLGLNEVTIYKDVLGVYSTDPKQYENALLYNYINLNQLVELAYFHNPILAYKACLFALNHHMTIHLKSTFKEGSVTHISKNWNNQKFLIPYKSHLFYFDENTNILDLGDEISLKDAHYVIIEEKLS